MVGYCCASQSIIIHRSHHLNSNRQHPPEIKSWLVEILNIISTIANHISVCRVISQVWKSPGKVRKWEYNSKVDDYNGWEYILTFGVEGIWRWFHYNLNKYNIVFGYFFVLTFAFNCISNFNLIHIAGNNYDIFIYMECIIFVECRCVYVYLCDLRGTFIIFSLFFSIWVANFHI